jgi:hypothetical protein
VFLPHRGMPLFLWGGESVFFFVFIRFAQLGESLSFCWPKKKETKEKGPSAIAYRFSRL